MLVGYVCACLALAACTAPTTPAQNEATSTAIAQAPDVPPATSVAATPTAVAPPATPTVAPTATPSFASPGEVPPLTLGTIFVPRNLGELRLDPARIRTIIATGDVIPGGFADIAMRDRNDYLFALAATQDRLRDADLTVINLEVPIIAGCPEYYPEFTFCGRVPFMESLQLADIDVATLENNHIDDYEQAGIDETIGRLQDAGIAWADRSTAAITDVRGLRFGFLAFDSVVAPVDREQMEQQIRQLRPNVDVLIVAVHWGKEYVALPEPAPSTLDDPLEIAHQIIDAGADLIIGNHPHQVQAVELYNGKLITYAHGNFVFGQMWSYGTRLGMIGRYTFYDNTLVGVEYTPTLIQDYAQPVPLTGTEAQDAITTMRDASERWARVVAGEEARVFTPNE
jgi:poly-gamma-glutamate synthesis protein (capsule biosynthesis protein)